jgi:hypothetical protein
VTAHRVQAGLRPGQARVALSVRGIGEGHISSIGFCSAVAGPGAQWSFEPRLLPVSVADTTPATWSRAHLRAVLAGQGHLDELAEAILHALPAEFKGADLDRALAKAHRDLLTRASSAATVDLLRKAVSAACNASFGPGTDLSQRILSPSAEEESNGVEDARFTRFVDDDGIAEYRATYTAYDGRSIAPRLLLSSDLREFRSHRLAGPAARNKGMALFPRKVRGFPARRPIVDSLRYRRLPHRRSLRCARRGTSGHEQRFVHEEVRRTDAPEVWVARDDGNDIVRATAIVSVGIDDSGTITARLGYGEAATVVLADPAKQNGAFPPDDFHRKLISTIAQLSDASGAFLVRPVHDEMRGWQWNTEPL